MSAKELDFGISGFDHVDLHVKDLTKARRFFVEQLKLAVIGEGPDHAFLLFGDQVLGLRTGEARSGTDGVDHIALRVESWTGLRTRLKRARLEVVKEKERDESRSLYLKGPDGLSLELVWRPDPHRHPVHR
ncbi:MAG: VOC family protein [Thermoplasmata archaeon]|nr:VOC family protein [Thermoplasmata archaeon]MCI4358837.1 VOC family protein [Thermoplasmata archaeon]